ncbi:hypothetical protein [Comamonas terrigena]|uniref:hypothetical protein n=1 Tax=Comamonas terrigena TaxID=32013 RepID=UPI00244BDDA7|nr:hypothetical protein [Comamonas terrigena]MDH0051023.1 hypothetical protein [Comamonas terrigena]MDH0513488.1 hypothetical protein [Comamonas terrigena]MDH1092968.1 hypothetical protein [Comamonas terrigena]
MFGIEWLKRLVRHRTAAGKKVPVTGWLCKNVPFCGTQESYVSFNTYGVTGYYLASTGDEGGASTVFSCSQNFPAF